MLTLDREKVGRACALLGTIKRFFFLLLCLAYVDAGKRLAYVDAGNALTLDDVQHAMILYSGQSRIVSSLYAETTCAAPTLALAADLVLGTTVLATIAALAATILVDV